MGKWAKGSPRPLRDLWGRPALPPLPSGKGWGEGPVFARSRAFWLFVAQPSRHRCWVPACAGMTRWEFDVCPLPSSPHRQAQSMQNARRAAPQGRAKRVNRRLSLSSLPFRDQQVLVQGVSSSCGGRVTATFFAPPPACRGRLGGGEAFDLGARRAARLSNASWGTEHSWKARLSLFRSCQ